MPAERTFCCLCPLSLATIAPVGMFVLVMGLYDCSMENLLRVVPKSGLVFIGEKGCVTRQRTHLPLAMASVSSTAMAQRKYGRGLDSEKRRARIH